VPAPSIAATLIVQGKVQSNKFHFKVKVLHPYPAIPEAKMLTGN
jgi:hypothetical protein